MTSPAGGLIRLSGLMQTGFEVQRRFRVLLKQLGMTGGAIIIGALHMRRMIEGHVAVLCRERELFRGLGLSQ